jgi:hypothetical protein
LVIGHDHLLPYLFQFTIRYRPDIGAVWFESPTGKCKAVL